MTAAISPESLYLDYHEKVERYVSSRIRHHQDAEDLTSDIFMRAYAALEGYAPTRAAPGTWLFAITRNAVADYLRAGRAHPACETLERLPSPGPDLETRLLTSEALELLSAALERLPERERNIIILRFYYGLTPTETAGKVGVSYANVRFLQHRAMKKLRNLLYEMGVTL